MIWIHGENINKKLQKKFSQTLNLNYLKKREIFMISEYFIENINISKKKTKMENSALLKNSVNFIEITCIQIHTRIRIDPKHCP